MTDRVPGAPGQYKAVIAVPELQKMQEGTEFTITITRDDQPITVGTPYSKAAVLPDELAERICPEVVDPTPADALRGLMDAVASGYCMELLWRNAAPTDSFGAQTIGISNMEEYQGFMLVHRTSKAQARYGSTIMMTTGNYYLWTTYKNENYYRTAHTTTDGIAFEGGAVGDGAYGTSGTSNNTCAIPIRIYGIRMVREV